MKIKMSGSWSEYEPSIFIDNDKDLRPVIIVEKIVSKSQVAPVKVEEV